jgi:uncharacterized protein YceK
VKNHLKLLIGVILVAALAGCASVQQAVQAYGSVAVTGAHAAADTVVQAQKVTICDLPYSAVQRDPQMAAVVSVLCGPLATQSAPKS